MVFKKKVYGQSKESYCPFCNKIALVKNDEGLLTCQAHKHTKFEEIRCACGSFLEQKSGKYGPFFTCIHCGIISYAKAMALKDLASMQGMKVNPLATLSQSSTKQIKGRYVNGEYIPSIDEL